MPQFLKLTAAERAKISRDPHLATTHQTISESARIVQGFNLDRKSAVLSQLRLINDALKAS